MKPNKDLIIIALDHLAHSPIVKHGVIPGNLEGQIAAFGGNVVQSGVMPALLFYKQKRNKIYTALEYIYIKAFTSESPDDLIKTAEKKIKASAYESFRAELMQCAVALKMAMRSYEFDKDNLEED